MKGFKKFDKKSQNNSNSRSAKPVKEKLNREIRFSRSKVKKAATLLLFSVVFLSLLFNVIFLSKYQTIRNTVKAGESQIEEKIVQLDEREDTGFSDSVVAFTDDFLKIYYNIPAETKLREKRLENMKRYFVRGFDVTSLETIDDFNGERKLIGARYIETDYLESNKMNVHFNVDYEITETKLAEKEEKGKKSKPITVKDSVEIVVPVVTDGKGYAVIENPSLMNRDLTATIKAEQNKMEGEDVSTTEKENLNVFLTEFFTSYGMSDEKLPFMANLQRGLHGKILSNLAIQDVAMNENGDYQMIVDVVYQNKETSFNGMYTYYLVASKEKNNYFVEEIKQGGF